MPNRTHEVPVQAELFAPDALPPADPHAELGAILVAPAVDDWIDNPLDAFIEWKRSQRVHGKEFADHSIEQYESMFGRFMTWLGEHGQHLPTTSAADIDHFLNSLRSRSGDAAAASTRRRYLMLLHHVFENLRLLEVRPDNPAAPLLDLTRHQDYERAAPTILPPPLANRYVEWTLRQPEDTWVEVRDKALRLIFLASAITVSEARACKVESVRFEEDDFAGIEVAAHGFVRERVAPVASYAVEPLRRWIAVRGNLDVQSDVLFVARVQDFLRCEPAPQAICANEIHVIVEQAMTAAGYHRQRRGPQTLRNSFIARQIREGKPVDRIMAWTGLKTTASIEAIERLVPKRDDGVLPA